MTSCWTLYNSLNLEPKIHGEWIKKNTEKTEKSRAKNETRDTFNCFREMTSHFTRILSFTFHVHYSRVWLHSYKCKCNSNRWRRANEMKFSTYFPFQWFTPLWIQLTYVDLKFECEINEHSMNWQTARETQWTIIRLRQISSNDLTQIITPQRFVRRTFACEQTRSSKWWGPFDSQKSKQDRESRVGRWKMW